MKLETKNLKNIELLEVEMNDLGLIKIGDEFIISLFLKNKSHYFWKNVKVHLEEPHMFGLIEDKTQIIKAINANEIVKIDYHAKAIIAGRDFLKFKITVKELFDLSVHTYQVIVGVNGEGLYRGDNHSHSTRSDGQNNNSVYDNALTAYQRGLSWLTPTDHCFINNIDCDEINQKFDDFLVIPGCAEYGQIGRKFKEGVYPVGNAGEHALQYRVKEVNNVLNENRRWQNIIDEVNAQGGLFYIAHPFYPYIWWNEEEAFNAHNLCGLEVWQGDYHALDKPNRLAFKLWDEMNSVGKKVNGIANSDAHYLYRLGHPFIMAKMPSLTIENIFDVLKSGHFYGSNGVHIRFLINGSENNEIAYIDKDKKAHFQIYIYDESPILSVKIYKNKISDQKSSSILFKEFSFDEEVNEFIEEFEEMVEENEFYRLEVVTNEATIGPGAMLGDFYGKGFGYTNPIYIKYGISKYQKYDDDVRLTKSGYPYYIKDKRFL